MSKQKKTTNPFYVVLIVAGVCFVLTAFAYFTMAVREASPRGAAPNNLMALVGQYGLLVMIVELAVLATATFGAIGTDEYWSRRDTESAQDQAHETDDPTDPT